MSSLLTAMQIGEAGLRANSRAMAMIADNTTNINTVGYKHIEAQFTSISIGSLRSGDTVGGGVVARAVQATDEQGLLVSTNSLTDVSIRGDGFFVTSNQQAFDGNTDNVFLTRAGSFRIDAEGNLVNTAGYYLQGWRFDDATDTLPGTAETRLTDYGLLETVNINGISGRGEATTQLGVRINLDAAQPLQTNTPLYETLRAVDSFELSPTGVDIVSTSVNTISSPTFVNAPIQVGDTVTLSATTSNNASFTVTDFDRATGTITVAEAVVAESIGAASATVVNPTPVAIGTAIAATGTVYSAGPNQLVNPAFIGANIAVGDQIRITGADSAATNNTVFRVTGFDSTTGTVTVDRAPTAGTDTASATFDVVKPDSPFALQDTIQAAGGGLEIDANSNTLRVPGLVNASIRAGDLISFGLDPASANDGVWQVESFFPSSGTVVLGRRVDGPDTTTPFSGNASDIASFLHIPSQAGLGGTVAGQATGSTLTADQINLLPSMARGDLNPDFQRSITIYDGQGIAHDFTMSFLKSSDANRWFVEITSNDAFNGAGTDQDHHPSGLISFGEVQFNPDGGTLDAANSFLYVPDYTAGANPPVTFTRQPLTTAENFEVIWDPDSTGAAGNLTDGLLPQTIETINFGSDGDNDGIAQVSTDNVLFSSTQNGNFFGAFDQLNIDDEGFVIATYTNGESERLYKLPIANGPAPTQLQNVNGNAYKLSTESGPFSLFEADTGTGSDFVAGTLEQSTAELSEQFTQLIVVQRAYSAAGRLFTTADEMLQEGARLKR